MQYTLFGSRGSGSAAIEAALLLCRLPYRQVRAATWEADSALDELARVNPLRQVPTLVLPGGQALTESAAILIHLGLTQPQGGLLPVAADAQAQALRGLVFIAANCYAAIGIIDYPERWTTASTQAAREKVRQGARRQLHRHWEIFADTFHAEPYLSGPALGALDLLAAVVSRWAGARAHLDECRPQFMQVLRRVEADEAVRAVFAAHWDA
ncbi:MAG: glutathione S-transferase [Rubrivivax sp.]|nr:glutathione S-transferase [Rubrivivax sp.]